MVKESFILNPFELRTYIEFLRIELIDTGFKLGLHHEHTIKASEELDYFIIEYQKLVK
jgi:hypothetical protein